MNKRTWNRMTPRSISHALELCKDYARDVHNLSVERIADMMALETGHHTVYKWIVNGSMPIRYVSLYERTCGINFVSRYIAASNESLLVAIPKGKLVGNDELLDLQTGVSDTVKLLANFYKGEADIHETLAAITASMTDLAGHQVNVHKVKEPELFH